MARTRRIRSVLLLMLAITVGVSFSFSFGTADTYAAVAKKPAKVTKLKKTYMKHYNYKLTWAKAKRAKKYKVYRATTKSGKYTCVKTTTARNYTAYVPPGKKYYFKVRGVNGKKLGAFSSKLYVCKTMSTERVAEYVPAYWNEELLASVDSFNKRSGTANFAFFTDAHWDTNTKRSPYIIRYLYDELGLNLAVFGGDIVAGTYNDDITGALSEIQEFKEYLGFASSKLRPDPVTQVDNKYHVLFTSGNHDFNTSSSKSKAAISEEQIYNILFEEQNRTFATVAQNGRCAYTDDTKHRVRYIEIFFDAYLDNADPTQPGLKLGQTASSGDDMVYPSKEELEWLKETVQDEKLTADWTVVLFTHGYWSYGRKAQYPTEKELRTPAGEKLGNYLLQLEGDAATKADIGLWMTGHTHRDLNRTISNGTDKILITCTNDDSYVDGAFSRGSGYMGGVKMYKGHDTEQVIDLVQIDTKNKKVYMTRVGAGEDREFDF